MNSIMGVQSRQIECLYLCKMHFKINIESLHKYASGQTENTENKKDIALFLKQAFNKLMGGDLYF